MTQKTTRKSNTITHRKTNEFVFENTPIGHYVTFFSYDYSKISSVRGVMYVILNLSNVGERRITPRTYIYRIINLTSVNSCGILTTIQESVINFIDNYSIFVKWAVPESYETNCFVFNLHDGTVWNDYKKQRGNFSRKSRVTLKLP